MKGLTKKNLIAMIGEVVGAAIKEKWEDHSKHVATQSKAHIDGLIAAARENVGASVKAGLEKGILAAQFIRSLGGSLLSAKRGSPMSQIDWSAKNYGKDAPITKVLSATNFTEGSALIPAEVSSEVIELLRPASVFRRSNPNVISLSTGTMSVPKITGGASAAYVDENQDIGITSQTFGNIVLTAKKLGTIVPISNDWLRRVVGGTDAMIRDDTVASLAQKSDLTFLRSEGTEKTPRGIRSFAPAGNIIAANATVNLANVTTDLGKLWLALANGNVRFIRPTWFASARTFNYLMNVRDTNGNFAFRDELLQGRLWGYPFNWSTQIPNNLGGGTDESEVTLIDMADAVLGDQEALILETFDGAAYHDGSAVVSGVSRDQTVIRAIQEHDLGMRHDESVAYLTGVKWI